MLWVVNLTLHLIFALIFENFMKWADYLISAVKYDSNRRIVQVRQHKDTGENIEEGEVIDRSTLISNLKHGMKYATIYNSNSNWKYGEKITLNKSGRENFIRTDSNKVEFDNLKFVSEIE